VREKVRRLKTALPEAEIFYSVKANSEPRIVQALVEEGCGVEVSSSMELGQALSVAAPAARIVSSNPIKTPQFLCDLHRAGVRRMAFDSSVEVDKIARYAPNSQVYLRLKIDDAGSDLPLSRKFGAEGAEAPALLRYAAGQGLTPIGLTFHVGSQCRNPQNWLAALTTCAQIVEQVSDQMQLEVINLGGGLPVQHTKKIPALGEIVDIVKRAQSNLFDNRVRYIIEPGRFLVGDAAVLVSSVIGKARRNEENWLYLDAGVFNGLMETVDHLAYEFDFDVPDERPWDTFTIAGPSCDPTDVIFTGQHIPDLQVDERFYILNAGAYTVSYASYFNGFAPPRVVYTDTACRDYENSLPTRLRGARSSAAPVTLDVPGGPAACGVPDMLGVGSSWQRAPG
jgi:ornithine decarboxylase